MSQVSKVLRRVEGGYAHWCPGCEEMHRLPDSWRFDGNLECPTFSPSFKHEGFQTINVNGKWTGEWVRDSQGNTVPMICHYHVAHGELQFCADCTHVFRAKTVPLPELPEHLTD